MACSYQFSHASLVCCNALMTQWRQAIQGQQHLQYVDVAWEPTCKLDELPPALLDSGLLLLLLLLSLLLGLPDPLPAVPLLLLLGPLVLNQREPRLGMP